MVAGCGDAADVGGGTGVLEPPPVTTDSESTATPTTGEDMVPTTGTGGATGAPTQTTGAPTQTTGTSSGDGSTSSPDDVTTTGVDEETTGDVTTTGVDEQTTGDTSGEAPCCEPALLPPCFEGADCCADGQWKCNEFDHTSTCEAPGAVCVGTCGGDVCEDDELCVEVGEDLQCLGLCAPLDVASCADDQMCAQHEDVFVCAPDVSERSGAVGDECEYANDCDAGNACITGEYVTGCEAEYCCSVWCDLDLADPCPIYGMSCVSWFEMGMAPPGLENLGICALV